jgi:hypothetical protein
MGALGAAAGVTALEAKDGLEFVLEPFEVELVVTLKVYATPFESPETVQLPPVPEVVTVQVSLVEVPVES